MYLRAHICFVPILSSSIFSGWVGDDELVRLLCLGVHQSRILICNIPVQQKKLDGNLLLKSKGKLTITFFDLAVHPSADAQHPLMKTRHALQNDTE